MFIVFTIFTKPMVDNIVLRILLAPFSLLYGLGVSFRSFLYRKGYLRSVAFSIPVISVGNLSVGGAGKTPHVEYLIRLLRDYINVATLSRGYGRKSRGFKWVHRQMNADEAGDEPLQYKRKFEGIWVAVGESRTLAIPEMLSGQPDLQVIILDDAFQHLAIRPGLNILLSEYSYPFTTDWLLPSGRLREWRSGYKRADLIIVSKCPVDLTMDEARKLKESIDPTPNQQIFFSYYQYSSPYSYYDPRILLSSWEGLEILLVTGIARTDYLASYLEQLPIRFHQLEFTDHHAFTESDMERILKAFRQLPSEKKILLTTEKDAMRLEKFRNFLAIEQVPTYILPVQVAFHFDQGPDFDATIQSFLLAFTS